MSLLLTSILSKDIDDDDGFQPKIAQKVIHLNEI